MLGTTQDVHERCLAEQELRKLNLAIERSPVMVMMTDLEGKIEYVNQHFCDITGYTAAEVIAVVTADKLGTAAPFVLGPSEMLTRIVTQRSAPPAAIAALVARGIAVVRA